MQALNLEEVITRTRPFCTAKELNFLESAKQFFASKGFLTTGQTSWLESISEKYSEEAVASANRWSSAWSQEHRQTALRVAYYYEANPPYYSNYVSKVFQDPENFTLTKREWDKFCENKYAKKIRKEYDSEQKFVQGACIQIRKTNKVSAANYNDGRIYESYANIGNRVGFVIKVNARPITRAARGSRIYQVLLTGASSPIYVHESDLKKARKVKHG